MIPALRHFGFVAFIGMEIILLAVGPGLRLTPFCSCLNKTTPPKHASIAKGESCCCPKAPSCCTASVNSKQPGDGTPKIDSRKTSACLVRQFLAIAKSHLAVHANVQFFWTHEEWQAETSAVLFLSKHFQCYVPRGPPIC